MPGPSHNLIVIGENINTTRKVRATSSNIVHEDGKVGYAYTGLDEYAVSHQLYIRAQKT